MSAFFKKTVAIIPAYQPKENFYEYAKELTEAGIERLIIVNDGSTKSSEHIFKKIAALPSVTVLSYIKNRGKGFALKYAFEYAISNFNPSYTFVCCDCDGQHYSSDVLRILKIAIENPDKMILGARDFTKPEVPWRSNMGNRLTRWVFKLLYHLSLMDTQTGLRAFSYSMLDRLIKISGERFEYEMNVLINLQKQNVEFKEVPIETVYAAQKKQRRKSSHFRTVKDSLRICGVLFKNIGFYALSSVLSAVLDVAIFYLLYNFIFTSDGSILRLVLPAVIARILSSIVNFTINFKFVFRAKSKLAVFKYYLLWSLQLALSCLTVFVLNRFELKTTSVTVFKALFDFVLAILSYKIQSIWVFKTENETHLKFYGFFLKLNRKIFGIFSPKYKSYVNPKRTSPAIYVARHMNLKGPIKLTQSLDFDVHTFVFYPFFSFKSCYRQYSEYTFTKRYNRRGIKAFFAKIGAFFAALYVPFLVRSSKAIPVYRTNLKTVMTYRTALDYLLRGESIAIFPDVDYISEGAGGEIYKGFIYLDSLYYKSYGIHPEFIVLEINGKKKEIREKGRYKFKGQKGFQEEMNEISESIRKDLLSNIII